MRALSIRASLTAWFFGLTMLLLAGFAVVLHARVSETLRDGLDERLRARAETLAALCEWEEDEGRFEFDLEAELVPGPFAEEPGRGIEIVVLPDLPLHRSGRALPAVAPAALVAAPGVRFDTVDDGGPLRLCAVTTPIAAPTADGTGTTVRTLLVRVSESLAPIERQIDRLAWIVLVSVAVATTLAATFGLFLSRRVVRPLARLERAATAVRHGATAPMPRRGNDDEVDRLAAVLDGTFAALHEALNRQARFTADAAHELRNPITVIASAAEVALRQDRRPEDYRAFLADIHATSRRMGRIVEGLLVLARLDGEAPRRGFEIVDLGAVAREAAAELDPGGERVRVRGEGVGVRGDAGLLRVLVDNLVRNALRHAPGTVVDVEVEARSGTGADGVVLTVRDRGPGIPEDARGEVFERFRRGAAAGGRAPEGAGLGLAIVREIARMHAAACAIEDGAPGARIVVRFPTPS